jgi:hypothetical protein
MTLTEWFLGKPRLMVSGDKRGPNLLVRLWRRTPFWDPVRDANFRTQVCQAYSDAALRPFGTTLEPTKNGEQIHKYGQYIGGGFETITGVGDSYLVDLLGSDHNMYYVRKDTFEDFSSASVWLVNTQNSYFVELVLYECVGSIAIVKRNVRIGSSNHFLELSELDGKPWNRELLRQSGINVPL